MSDLFEDVPDSPPTPPVIPEGPASKYGKAAAALLTALAAVLAIFDINVDLEQLTPLVPAVLLLITYMQGRYKQAAAIYRDGLSPRQLGDARATADVGLGSSDEPYDTAEDFDISHEQRDLHDGDAA